MGRESESFEVQKAAYAIDPLSVLTLNNHLNNLRQRRQFDEMAPVIERLEQLDPVRAATFRAWIMTMHRQHADAAIELFRGVDMDADQTRIRAAAANTIAALNLNDEARLVWPFPDAEVVFSKPDDAARTLELSKLRYEKASKDADALEDLAWAYLMAGNNTEAKQWAERYLEQLDEKQRPSDYTNAIFAIDAWQRDDPESVDKYLAPIDQRIAKAHEAGLDVVFMRWSTALHEYMRGNEDEAAAAMEIALSREVMFREWMDHSFRLLGLDQNPRFVAIKADYERYIDAERLKFLEYACGEIGFTSWKPQKETCRPVSGPGYTPH
jgi:tetratricopeptide (TPR) repeat protein